MTSEEIRQAVIRATQLDTLFEKEDLITPVKIQRFELSQDIVAVEIVPGKQFILFMHLDGSIRLHHMQDFTNSIAYFPPPERLASRRFHSRKSVLLASRKGKLIAFVTEDYTALE